MKLQQVVEQSAVLLFLSVLIYNAIDHNTEGGRYEDTTYQPTYGVGSCGGGSASVLNFIADTAGTYAFQAEATGAAPGFMG